MLGSKVPSDATIAERDARRDAELVEEARRGNDRALTELIDRHRELVYSLAYALTGSRSQSEEVTQEAFVTVWRRLPHLQNPERFRSWVCGIVRLLSRGLRRDQRRHFALFSLPLATEIDVASAEPSPLERAMRREEECFLQRALGAMPEIYRAPLVLFYREQQSVARVAQALDVSEIVIEKRLSRGRRLLQRKLLVSLESALTRMKTPKGLTASVMAAIALAGARPADAAGHRTQGVRGLTPMRILVVGTVAFVGMGGPLPRSASQKVVAASRLMATTQAPPAFDVARERRRGAENDLAGESDDDAYLTRPTGRVPATVMSFDFEDGDLPRPFTAGHLVSGPSRPGNRYCLTGTVVTMRSNEYPTTITLGSVWDPSSLFSYSRAMRISFDYWVGKDWDGVVVQVWDNNRGLNFRIGVTAPVPERWNHAEVKVADFTPYLEGAPPMDEGDELRNVVFSGGPFGYKPFYIDNLKIVDPAIQESQ